MFDIVSVILGIIIIVFTNLYIWSKLLKQKIDFKSPRTYILIFMLSNFMILNYYYINQFLKVVSITLIMMIFCKFIFKVSINKAIVVPLISQFIIMISELLFLLLVLFVLDFDMNQMVNNYFGSLVSNLLISFFAIILINFKMGHKLYNLLLKVTSKINKYELIIFPIILVISVNLVETSIYYRVNMFWLIVINTSLIIIYSVIIFKMANARNDYLTIADKYNISKDSLSEYQTVINRYRIDNHENKSQLKRLRNKINKDNKEALEYIDMILDTRIKENERVLNKTKVIPESDLKVLIDSKIMTMEEKKIKNTLHVDNYIKTIDFIEMDNLLMEDICKIVGVYLDNAIEAVENLKKHEIQIDLYQLDSFLCISVVNNCENKVDLERIYDTGYTTKTEGHGYGLALVNEIIESNSKLSKETHYSDGTFRQVLKIKM